MRLKLLLTAILGCSFMVSAFESIDSRQDKNRLGYDISNEDLYFKPCLFAESIIFYQANGDERKMDSVFKKALQFLWKRNDHKSIIKAYTNYLNFNRDYFDVQIIQQTCRDMVAVATACNENECLAIARTFQTDVFLAAAKPDSALKTSAMANDAAALEKDNRLIYNAQIVRAKALERSNIKEDAFKILQNVRFNAEMDNDKPLLAECYGLLSDFYEGIGSKDSALAKRRMQLKILDEIDHQDARRIMPVRLELARAVLKINESEGIDELNEILSFAVNKNDNSLKADVLQYFRDYYLSKDDYRSVSNMYQRVYVNDSQLRANDEGLWCRLHAVYCIAANKTDSAIKYFEKACKIVLTDGSTNYFKSYIFLQYGHYLSKDGKTDSAISKLKTARFFCEMADNYHPFMIKITSELSALYAQKNQYNLAYATQLENRKYISQDAASVKEDALLRQDIFLEAKKQEKLAAQAEQRLHDRHVAQYTFIAFAIAFIFLLLAILGSFSVPKFLIRSTGILAFIFLFEFIVLITDTFLEHITNDEPLKMLLFKVLIILLITPLHHWSEEKVLHYLNKHKLINTAAFRQHPVFIKVRKLVSRRRLHS